MSDRKTETRRLWVETMAKHRSDYKRPGSEKYWAPKVDTASRDELIAIQNEKLKVLTPFLYENSPFYRRRFERLGLTPTDIQSVDDLTKWPVVDKAEMAEDATNHPPYGTYSTIDDQIWAKHGWMLFSTSGSSGVPRVFRFTHVDREYFEWSNARALTAMNIGPGEVIFPMVGFGPHSWIWGAMVAFQRMGIAVIPGGGMDAKARGNVIDRFKPTVIGCTPSYALYLGRTMQEMGLDPAKSSVNILFTGGEPAMGIDKTRQRLEDLWDCRVAEFYGCTESSPHVGGYTCPYSVQTGHTTFTHLMEDTQIWEVVDPATLKPVAEGERGITVCTNLCSESGPHLRFLVGDYTVLNTEPCECGRSHVRAMGSMQGRADDLINLRGIKLFPTQIESAVRAIPDIGDEFQIRLHTTAEGLDVMEVSVEHVDYQNPASIVDRVVAEIRTRCEVRAGVTVLAPDSLPKTEFKAKRVRDEREL